MSNEVIDSTEVGEGSVLGNHGLFLIRGSSKRLKQQNDLVAIALNGSRLKETVPKVDDPEIALTESEKDLEKQSPPVEPMTTVELQILRLWNTFHFLYCLLLAGAIGYITCKICGNDLCKFENWEVVVMCFIAGCTVPIVIFDYSVLKFGEYKLKWESTTAVLKGYWTTVLSFVSSLLINLTVVAVTMLTLAYFFTGTSVFYKQESVQTALPQ